MYKLISFATLFVLFFVLVQDVLAIGSAPNFPSCVNPQGNLKVRYETGSHAVIGDIQPHDGKDEVYWLESGNALQCLCPTEGDATQTNWWNVSGITQEEIDQYKSQGWHFVPSGSVWGLINEPYMAKNFVYSCRGGSNSGGDSGIGGGGSSSTLGLATTGDNITYIALFCLGLSFVSGGLLLRKH